jgi:two-component system chemotaxis sensor kinase CheA
MMESDIVSDFLVESQENLDRLDRELVGLEKDPSDREALAGIFRTVHTIKGACGFLGFEKLEKVAHAGESLLALLRDGKLTLSAEINTPLLSMVDAIRQMLSEIQATGRDGESGYPELLEALAGAQNPRETAILPRATTLARVASPETASSTPPDAPSGPPSGPPPAKAIAAATAPQCGPSASHSAAQAETIRVGVNLLDNLMNLVGELVLARNQLLQFSNAREDASLQAVSQRLNLIASELQEEVMKTRMQPIGNVWNQFPRTVRDVALSCGKEVSIEMEGKDTELDKTIIEAIKDPLTHLVRNSVDHGIEFPEERMKAGKNRAGRLTLRAFHEGGQVNIEISDDGAGLNRDRILQKAVERGLATQEQASRMADREIFSMIFLPGFSTAAKVTNVSGRGVGMDVVRINVEKIGGSVDIQSKKGEGTAVRIKIPLTLAIIPALMVACGKQRFAIPQVNLIELVRTEPGSSMRRIECVHGAPVYRLRGRLLPLAYLRKELRLPPGEDGESAGDHAENIVVLQVGDRRFGLVVDEVNDTQEIVVKPLRRQLKAIKTFAGASIMGDGKIALILDVMGVAQRSGVISSARDRALADEAAKPEAPRSRQTFLLFAGPDDARMALPIESVDRLEELPAARVEQSGARWVTQYRGRILPLVHLADAFEERRERPRSLERLQTGENNAPFQVLVCRNEGQPVGLVVERIVDIVEDAADVRYPASRAGVLHTAIIDGRVTELIDVAAILRSSGVDRVRPLEYAEVPH